MQFAKFAPFVLIPFAHVYAADGAITAPEALTTAPSIAIVDREVISGKDGGVISKGDGGEVLSGKDGNVISNGPGGEIISKSNGEVVTEGNGSGSAASTTGSPAASGSSTPAGSAATAGGSASPGSSTHNKAPQMTAGMYGAGAAALAGLAMAI